MNETILIVDDDPVQLRILDGQLTKMGYRVETTESGDDALGRLKADPQRFDLVVLDLVMPGLDGMGVLERLTQLGIRTPVIVQTANGGIDTVVSAMRAGASDFVVKPVGPERLHVSVRNAAQDRRPGRGTEPGAQARQWRIVRHRHPDRIAGHEAHADARRARRLVEYPGPHRRRIRRRQGTRRPRHPGHRQSPRQALRHRQLRRDPGKPGRKHAVRP